MKTHDIASVFRGLRRSTTALALALAALACAWLPGPAQAASLEAAAALGNALWGNFVGNHTVGGPTRAAVALRGRAPFAACFDTFSTYLIASANKPGYSAGDGGTLRISVQTLDASLNPSGQVLGQPAVYSPQLIDGGLAPGQTVAGTLFHTVTFPAPACLTAGQDFAVVFENTAPDPVNNYIGVDTLGVSLAANSPAIDPIWRTLMWYSGSWHIRLPDEYHTPIIRLCESGSGRCILQTRMEYGGYGVAGGQGKVRQTLTVRASGTVSTCYLLAARASSAATRLRLALADRAGHYLATTARTGAYRDLDISALPVATDPLAVTQLRFNLPAPVALTAGQQIEFLIGSRTPRAAFVPGAKDGTPYFATVSGDGTADEASHSEDGGVTWAPYDSAHRTDIGAYCT